MIQKGERRRENSVVRVYVAHLPFDLYQGNRIKNFTEGVSGRLLGFTVAKQKSLISYPTMVTENELDAVPHVKNKQNVIKIKTFYSHLFKKN